MRTKSFSTKLDNVERSRRSNLLSLATYSGSKFIPTFVMIIVIKKHYLALLFFLFLVTSICFSELLTIESVENNKIWINEFIKNNYLFSVLLFFLSCVIFVNSPIPLAAIIKVLGGFFFGFYLGAIYNVIATALACLIGFGISRYALKEIFEKVYYERVRNIETELENNGFYYFLTLRIIMVVPYFIINIMAGISKVSFKKYLFSTILGVTPASLIYANGGSKLEHISSISELFESDVVVSLLLIALVSLVPVLVKKTKARLA